MGEDILAQAVETGHLELVQWVHETFSDCRVSTGAMDIAAYHSLDIVKWLHENKSEGCSPEALNSASSSDNLDSVKWFHEHRPEGIPSRVIIRAADCGHLEVVVFLSAFCSNRDMIRAMKGAAFYGHLNIVQWLWDNRVRDQDGISETYHNATDANHLEVVTYLAQYCGSSCPSFDYERIVRRKDFHLLEWLMQYGPAGPDAHRNRARIVMVCDLHGYKMGIALALTDALSNIVQ